MSFAKNNCYWQPDTQGCIYDDEHTIQTCDGDEHTISILHAYVMMMNIPFRSCIGDDGDFIRFIKSRLHTQFTQSINNNSAMQDKLSIVTCPLNLQTIN